MRMEEEERIRQLEMSNTDASGYVKLDSTISYRPSGTMSLGEKRRQFQALKDFCSYKEPVDV